MIRHIVLWKVHVDRREFAREMADRVGQIIDRFEGVVERPRVHYNLKTGDKWFHVVLEMAFETQEQLDAYMDDAEHRKGREEVAHMIDEITSFDYEEN